MLLHELMEKRSVQVIMHNDVLILLITYVVTITIMKGEEEDMVTLRIRIMIMVYYQSKLVMKMD
jgi:hypothetical protein